MDVLAGGVAAEHPRLFGCAAVRLLPGLTARDRQGASSGSLSSIAKPPSVMVTRSSVTLTSSQVSATTSSICCDAAAGPAGRLAVDPAREVALLPWSRDPPGDHSLDRLLLEVRGRASGLGAGVSPGHDVRIGSVRPGPLRSSRIRALSEQFVGAGCTNGGSKRVTRRCLSSSWIVCMLRDLARADVPRP